MAIAALCLLVIGGLWLGLSAWSRLERSEILADAVHRDDNLAVAFEQYTIQTFRRADAALQAVKHEYRRAGSRIDLTGLLADLEINRDLFLGIGIIDEHGDLVATTMATGPATSNFADREHFTFHRPRDTGALFVGKPVQSRLTGTTTIPMTRRINRPDGSFGGVAVVQIEPTRFTEFYRQATLRPLDAITLVGLDGIARARRLGDKESSGEDLSKGGLFEELARGPVGHSSSLGLLDGTRRLFSFRKLKDYPFVVTAGEEEASIFASFEAKRQGTYGVAAVFTFLLILIAGMLMATMARNRRALETIARNEELLHAAFEQAAVGVVHTDLDGCIMRANQKFCDIVGYSVEELRALKAADLTGPDEATPAQGQVDELVLDETGRNAPQWEVKYLRKDGRTVLATVNAAAVRDRAGKVDHFVAMVQDITRRKQQETELQVLSQRMEAQFRILNTALSSTTDFAYILDHEARFIYANQALLDLWGLSLSEAVGRNFVDLRYPDDHSARMRKQVRQVVETRMPVRDEMHYVDGANVGRDYEYILNPVIAEDGSVDVVSGSTRDITVRRRAEEALRLQADLLAAVGQAVIATDLDGHIIYSNPVAERLYGWTSAEMAGRQIGDVAQLEMSEEQTATLLTRLRQGETRSGEFQARHRNGTRFPVQLTDSPIHDPSGRLVGNIGVSSDISERKAYEGQVVYLATHDALTGLPNRNLLNDRLTQALAHAQRSDTGVAVVFLDVDYFKYINDGFGHPVGDSLLKAVAERLCGLLRTTDTVARFGGDEFVMVLTDIANPLSGTSTVGRLLVDSFARPFTVDGREFTVTASIGISVYPADGRTLDELLKNADAALYRAKELGRNNFQLYGNEMSEKARERVSLEVALRHAEDLGQLELHYQPLVLVRTGEAIGVEALIRWRHPTLGLIAPGDFIPLAEETGLIVPIGEWALRTACLQNKAWQDEGLPALTVAVNVSALQLRRPDFVGVVADALERTGLDPGCLDLELTESMVMGRSDRVIECLNQLRELGVSVSMDDFGTGYSNLGQLAHLPLDTLKIDRSFVRDLPGHTGAGSIARAIVSMARSMDMRVVAEGVETVEQAQFLESISCEHAQGFLYCRPLPADQFSAWIRSRIAGTRALKKASGGAFALDTPELAGNDSSWVTEQTRAGVVTYECSSAPPNLSSRLLTAEDP